MEDRSGSLVLVSELLHLARTPEARLSVFQPVFIKASTVHEARAQPIFDLLDRQFRSIRSRCRHQILATQVCGPALVRKACYALCDQKSFIMRPGLPFRDQRHESPLVQRSSLGISLVSHRLLRCADDSATVPSRAELDRLVTA